MKKTTSFALFSILLTLWSFDILAQHANHPLDPLTWQEHWILLETLHQEGKLDSETRFSIVNLQEPDKQIVWNWTPGDAAPRRNPSMDLPKK